MGVAFHNSHNILYFAFFSLLFTVISIALRQQQKSVGYETLEKCQAPFLSHQKSCEDMVFSHHFVYGCCFAMQRLHCPYLSPGILTGEE